MAAAKGSPRQTQIGVKTSSGHAAQWHSGPRQQTGIGLIEIMIAVLVLAIGMLGVGATLTTALRNNQSSMHRTQASIQAHAAMDMMRADKAHAVIGQYNLTQWTCNAPSSDNAPGAGLAAWIGTIKRELGPDACGRINCSNISCSVDVRWDDSRGMAGNREQTYGIVSRL